MNSTWSMQTSKKNSVNAANASSLSAPRPSKSLRRGESQAARCLLYSATFRARP